PTAEVRLRLGLKEALVGVEGDLILARALGGGGDIIEEHLAAAQFVGALKALERLLEAAGVVSGDARLVEQARLDVIVRGRVGEGGGAEGQERQEGEERGGREG